jgi:hypothetical protein
MNPKNQHTMSSGMPKRLTFRMEKTINPQRISEPGNEEYEADGAGIGR